MRRELERRLSALIDGRITIGAVDLSLWRGKIALLNVAVYSTAAPPPPLLQAERVSAEVRPAALLRRPVRIGCIVIDRPVVDLARLEDGGLNLFRLVRRGGSTAPPKAPGPAAAASGASTGFGIDRVEIHDGRLDFRDLAVGAHEPLKITVEKIEVDRIALVEGVYTEPSSLRLRAHIGEGTLQGEVRIRTTSARMGVHGEFQAEDLPLEQTRFYVSGVGWSKLEGRASGSVTYVYESAGAHQLEGRVRVAKLAIGVPQLEPLALRLDELTASGAKVDLRARRAAFEAVTADDSAVAVAPEREAALSYLKARAKGGHPDPLDPKAMHWLEQRLAAVEVGSDRLRELARARGGAHRYATWRSLRSSQRPAGASSACGEPRAGGAASPACPRASLAKPPGGTRALGGTFAAPRFLTSLCGILS